MKIKLIFSSAVILIAAIVDPYSIFAQGSFNNLDFESANLTPVPSGQFGGFVPISDGLPSWTGYLGNTITSQVLQNNMSLGAASIDILGPNFSTTAIIDGNYSVVLQAGGTGNGGTENASIAQNGIIPANSRSLQFKAFGTTDFSVSFAGNILSPFIVSTGQSSAGQGYDIYGVDITAYAGDSGQLEFNSIFNAAGSMPLTLDDITFSTQAVPEPNTLELILVGGTMFGLIGWRKRGKIVLG